MYLHRVADEDAQELDEIENLTLLLNRQLACPLGDHFPHRHIVPRVLICMMA